MIANKCMGVLGLAYRDRDAGCTKKTFIERLAAQAVTRVRRNLFPLLRFKTPQMIKENGKKQRKRGSPRATKFNDVIHVKTTTPTKKNKGNDFSHMPNIGSVVVSETSNTIMSPLTENGSKSGINQKMMRVVFEEYLNNGGVIKRYSDMEKLVNDFERGMNNQETEHGKSGERDDDEGCNMQGECENEYVHMNTEGVDQNGETMIGDEISEVGMGLGVVEKVSAGVVENNDSTESELEEGDSVARGNES